MNRQYNLRLDLQFRCNNSTMKFDEFDKDTSDFFIEVTRGGKVIDISNALVTLVAIKPSKKVEAQFIEVQNNSIYGNLRPSMKDEVGKYQCIASISLNGETVNIGIDNPLVYEVTENKLLRQLNQEVISEERFTILTDMINRLNSIELSEAGRVEAENSRVEAEKLRKEAIEKIKTDIEKLITDTKKEISDYKNAKDTAIDNDLKQFKEVTSQAIDNYKSAKDTEINNSLNEYKSSTTDDIEEFKNAKIQELDDFKNTKNSEIDNYKREKDLAINQYLENKNLELDEYARDKNKEIDDYKTSKDKEIDLYKKNKDTLINNKISEVEASKQNIISTANNKISELDQAKTDMKNDVNSKLEEADNRITELQNYESQMQQIESKNIEQDNRLKDVEYKNKVQDVYVSGLFNENNDKRLTIEGEGNSLKLEGSKEGLVTVDKVVGNTLVNINKYLSDKSLTINNEYYKQHIVTDINMIKLNVDYTLVFDIVIKSNNTEFTIEGTTNYLVCQIGESKTQNGITGHPTLNYPSTYRVKLSNHNRILFNVKNWSSEDSKYFAIRSLCKSNGEIFTADETIEYEIKNIMLLEGDYTSKPIPSEYFEGMQSTFEECKVTQQMVDSGEELAENLGKYKCLAKVRGKNLFDGKLKKTVTNGEVMTVESNSIIFNIPNVNKWCNYASNIIKLKPNTDYYLKADVDTNGATITETVGLNIDVIMASSGKWFSGTNLITTKTSSSLTTRFNSKYCTEVKLALIIRTGFSGKIKFSNIQLEEGTQATPYEPFVERTQTVYLNSPLLKGDEIVCKEEGLYHYHKCATDKVPNNITYYNSIQYYNNTSCAVLVNYQGEKRRQFSNVLLCDKLNAFKSFEAIWSSHHTEEGISTVNDDYDLCIRLNHSKTGVTSNNESEVSSKFKQYLLNNDFYIVGELNNPYYEKISDDKLLLEIPNNATLSVESVIPCTSISATYTGNIPSVYGMENSILEIEEHNVDMVATTFDMDYRLLEVEWALEDAGLVGISLASTFNSNRKGEKTMALSRYEQAKIMILGGAYDKATLTKQLTRYLEKNIITKEEYDELLALMEAKELVTGE